LSSKRLRQIKREIRVLGVAVGNTVSGVDIVGVIFRGSLWLDGVLRAHSENTDVTEAIANMLKDSPHEGQVRIIFLNQANLLLQSVKISVAELSSKVERPVILLGPDEGRIYLWRKGVEKTTFSPFGISRWSAEGVLIASTREGVIPEALRVAALTLSVLPDRLNA
jgi:endonuclease V-like protein UPF0215 family